MMIGLVSRGRACRVSGSPARTGGVVKILDTPLDIL